MVVRTADISDYVLLRQMAKDCEPLDVHTPYTYWVVCQFFHDSCFIVEDDGKAVGSIMTILSANCLFIWQIGVLKEYRRQGISQLLYKSVFDYARINHIDKVALTVSSDNSISNIAIQQFCKHNGLVLELTGLCDIALPDEDFHEKENFFVINL